MTGKGSGRRPGKGYREGHDRIFQAIRELPIPEPMECPRCGEIELRPTGIGTLVECHACHHEEQ